jgi:DNA-binding CsgD family transcriptional regulator
MPRQIELPRRAGTISCGEWEHFVVDGPIRELLGEARTALRAGDGAAARRILEPALAAPPTGEVLECLARAAFLELDFPGAIEGWQQAYTSYRETGDPVGSVRAARSLACLYGTVAGDWAVASGWLARAQTLLADSVDSPEAGWVALNIGMFESLRQKKEQRFRDALELARRTEDTELELVTLAYLGASLVHEDRTADGMRLLDEALAAVSANEVDDFFVLEEVFCQLFAACEYAHDVGRADQWIRVGEDIAARRNLPAVSAFCRTHYGGLLTTAGRWPEADAALTEAVRLWALGQRSVLRQGALVRLADLRVRQGRLEEAEQLLDGLELNIEAARPLAAIHLERGEPAGAREVLERALAQLDPTSAAAAPLVALLVDVHLAASSMGEAEAAARTLAACAVRYPGPYVQATAALAQSRVCLATGSGDPRACLRDALTGFADAQMPMELARARLQLAKAVQVDDPAVALAQARAAMDGFEALRAARDADEAASLLRLLGAKVAPARRSGGVLSSREEEVLALLGHGLSNPEISERLFISRKTVEHHVGNVLAKLGLRSRAEAAAYLARARPGGQ